MPSRLRPCDVCGRDHQGKARSTCRDCRREAGRAPGPEHALTGGYWRNEHGVQRWVAA